MYSQRCKRLKRILKPWDRDEALRSVRNRLWRYLSGDAAAALGIEPLVEALWGLPPGELVRLASAHLATSDLALRMLKEVIAAIPKLPSSVDLAKEEYSGRVFGPVDWSATLTRRVTTRRPDLFICRPPSRQYDTQLARLIVLALRELIHVSELASIAERGPAGRRAAAMHQAASRILRSSKLAGVKSVPRISDRVMDGVVLRYGLGATCEFVRAVEDATGLSDHKSLRRILSDVLLVPEDPSRVFELQVGFAIIDALVELELEEVAPHLIPGDRAPLGELQRPSDGARFRLWWQRSPWDIRQDIPVTHSRYRQVLVDAQIAGKQPLRPDFVLEAPDRSVLLIEVKHTLTLQTPERVGIRDMLAYLDDTEAIVSGQPYPHGLVVAWGATARPSRARVIVSDLDDVADAMGQILQRGGLPCWQS